MTVTKLTRYRPFDLPARHAAIDTAMWTSLQVLILHVAQSRPVDRTLSGKGPWNLSLSYQRIRGSSDWRIGHHPSHHLIGGFAKPSRCFPLAIVVERLRTTRRLEACSHERRCAGRCRFGGENPQPPATGMNSSIRRILLYSWLVNST